MDWLRNPSLYGFSQSLLGRPDSFRRFVGQYLRPVPGERLLDLGCGTARILDFLPVVDYWGLDSNGAYIAYAEKRYGPRARFAQADLLKAPWPVRAPFDRAVASGLLHHLSDDQAQSVLKTARALLGPRAKLITIDGCFERRQSPLARLLLAMDRGRFVRSPEDYVRLAGSVFKKVHIQIERGFLRLPYSHAVMEMSLG